MIYTNTCQVCKTEFATLYENHQYCDECFIEIEEQYYSPEAIEKRKGIAQEVAKELRKKLKQASIKLCTICGRQYTLNPKQRSDTCPTCRRVQKEQRLYCNSSHNQLNERIRVLKNQVNDRSDQTVGVCYSCNDPFILPQQLWLKDIPVFCSHCQPVLNEYPVESK